MRERVSLEELLSRFTTALLGRMPVRGAPGSLFFSSSLRQRSRRYFCSPDERDSRMVFFIAINLTLLNVSKKVALGALYLQRPN
jgi:hypothetical protein